MCKYETFDIPSVCFDILLTHFDITSQKNLTFSPYVGSISWLYPVSSSQHSITNKHLPNNNNKPPSQPRQRKIQVLTRHQHRSNQCQLAPTNLHFPPKPCTPYGPEPSNQNRYREKNPSPFTLHPHYRTSYRVGSPIQIST